MTGRLKKGAYSLAVKLRLPRQNGTTVYGDEALSAMREPEIVDVNGIVTHAATPSGMQALLKALTDAYGIHDQDELTIFLSNFFRHSRGGKALTDYCTGFRLKYEEAEQHAGLQINEVGLTHMFLENSGMDPKEIKDIKKHVGFDLSKFAEIYSYTVRMAKNASASQQSDPHAGNFLADGYAATTYLTDDEGHWFIRDAEGYEHYLAMDETEYLYWASDVDECWYGYEEEEPEETYYEGSHYDTERDDENYFGKGKGKGNGKRQRQIS